MNSPSLLKARIMTALRNRPWLSAVALLVFLITVVACAGTAPTVPPPTVLKAEPTKATPPTALAAQPTSAPAQQPAGGGILKFALSAEPPKLDPNINTGTAATTIKLSVYRGLLNYYRGGKISPELAESYTQENDTTYLFRLRKNAFWHNGDPVTADDVKFTFDRIRDSKTGASLFSQLQVIDSIQIVDDKTIRFKLKEPMAPFTDYLAQPEASIVNKKFVEAGNDLATKMMGAGPFVFKQYEKGVKLILEKNSKFYKEGLPKLDGIQFIPYPDENLRVTALKTGDVDLIEFVPWKDMPALEKDPNISMQGTGGAFMYLIYNTTVKPFDNPAVRRALGYAIDRKAILDAAFVGRGTPMFGLPILKESFAYDKELDSSFEYNPTKAKQLLAEAGFPNGFSAKLMSTKTYAMHEQTAVVVADSLKKIGVNVTLDLPEWGVRVERGNKGDYEFAIQGTGAEIIDPDYLNSFFCLQQIDYRRSPNYKNADICKLMAQARTTFDTEKRKPLYKQLGLLALDDSPYVFLDWREQAYAYRKTVEGFENLPGWLTFYSGTVLDSTSLSAKK